MLDNYTQRAIEQAEASEKVILEGVGKDAEIVVNDKGGKQSKSPIAMHLIDPNFLRDWFNDPQGTYKDNVITSITDFMLTGIKSHLIDAIFEVNCICNSYGNENQAIITIAKVLKEGAEKYAPNNWRLIPEEEHLNHALTHYMADIVGDTQDNHLAHCMCRLMMAYATAKSEGFEYGKYVNNEL